MWFEVSQHTGRIHLHANNDGNEHLHGSFLPEQLFTAGQLNEQAKKRALERLGEESKSVIQEMNDHYENLPAPLDTNVDARVGALQFLQEWTSLSAMKKNLLIRTGKPLRPPLSIEVKAAQRLKKEALRQGTLKGT